MLLLSDLFLCMGFKLMLIVALNESVWGMESLRQSQRDWVASIRKLLQVRIAQVGWCCPTQKIYRKNLPCSCPILFSRSDTSISTSMISKSFEMHSLIINPVNEFFYQSKWISVFYSSVTFWYFLSLSESLLNHFPVTFWPITRLFLSWPWPLSGYKSVSS